MANSIKTTGMASGTIQTSHKSGESVSKWVARHNETVEHGTPGNTLTTIWPSATGTQTVTSNREELESNSDFTLRHEAAYMTQMEASPPVP